MALYNKDGTVYKLVGPNPAMKTQILWGDFVLHNLKWDGEKAEDKNVQVAQVDLKPETFLESLDKAKAEIKVVEVRQELQPEPIERKPIVKADPVIQEELNPTEKINKVFVHCLPATLRERKDELYGDTYKTIQYGERTSFEGIMIEDGDLSVQIWTDSDKIGISSILYPKTNGMRWWRVQNKEPKANGWILTATPSDYQPSFV